MSKHLLFKGNFKHFTNSSGKTDRFEKNFGSAVRGAFANGAKNGATLVFRDLRSLEEEVKPTSKEMNHIKT